MRWKQLLLVVSALGFCAKHALCGTVEVCKDCKVRTLAHAVAYARSGDTIILVDGYYPEYSITIDKPLVLHGRAKPTIDGSMQESVLIVKARGVVIEGIRIVGSGTSALDERAGIKAIGADSLVIRDVLIDSCAFGIALYRSNRCTIQRVHCRGLGGSESSSGNGIHLWRSWGCTIGNSIVERHRDGLYFEFSSNCLISDNLATLNTRYGLHFMFSDSNVYTHNTFVRNGAGVAVMYSRYATMERNTFADNWGASSYGLLLKDISNSVVAYNTFISNTTGVYMEGSDYTVLQSNGFFSNGWAVKVLGSATNDTIACNTFISNSFDLLTNSYSSSLVMYRNYWDQYRGYDLNRDGVGDIPYRPVSLFALLVERIPAAIMLLRSFVVELLSFIERAIPTVTPSQVVDSSPSMVQTVKRYTPLQSFQHRRFRYE